ncbi:helix-turn-helix domain-containing protein [Actinoplanes sp. NPDC020271]|uniref:helix-turn-helix domain-containing protein n=1 Tax=Actinoplanes sp. NPDC020271 TaxID=3363896 RepID=UPI0037B8D448
MVRRRQLGSALRQYRIDADLSVKDVAGRLLCSPSKISRMESAQRNISARDVRDLIDIYRITDPDVRAHLMQLAEESRETAWWAPYNLGPAYERLIGLEGSATVIYDYQMGAVPGLLQIPEYTAAVVGEWNSDPDAVRKAVEVRQARQKFISENTKLEFVVDESVFRRSVGGPETMRAQIRKLVDLSEGSTIELQVVPFSSGAHQGMVTGFNILRFASSQPLDQAAGMSDVVYLEGVVEPAYLEQADEVDGYLTAFFGLQRKALTKQETISFMRAVLRDL